jgi:nifR3 family TIM-barrel protein
MAKALNHRLLGHFDIIDINMGCPVSKVTKNGEGSALMSSVDSAKKIISYCAAAGSRPVTVKFRRGYRGVDNAVPFAKMCEDAGAVAVTVHPRFSEQAYSGVADYQTVKNVKSAVKIPVILSGDVRDAESYRRALDTGCSAVMIGRAALGNPWIFQDFSFRPTFFEIKKTIIKQITLAEKNFSERYILCSMRRHIAAYLKTAMFTASSRHAVMNKIYTLENTEVLKDFILTLS